MSATIQQHRMRGFTLLELMVAIAIFVIFSAMAYGGLMTVLNSRADIEESLDDTRSLQMALFRLEQDIEQIRARAIRDEFGDPRPAVFLTDTQDLEFTRGGRRNPMNLSVSSLERVAYGLEDEELIRYSWAQLDRVQDTQVSEVVLLDDVISLQWRFLDGQKEWTEQWPVPDPTTGGTDLAATPQVIELRFETRRWGELRALYRITTTETST
ncbi:type II secretion system minor pseudopilin GspJ [uncultured Abyssibacter sp.]|uniref:type II secretion system minor pseudopilin GspJ n=1 Tax=uncultured Abyssibacter sp. TaxID=2320202 RepID=UPI0032B2069D